MRALLRLIVTILFGALGIGCGATQTPAGEKTDYDVIVVGAGMGGLSAAVHLANAGMKVLVLEQGHQVGGCTTAFSRGEFRFDASLHEMTLGGGDGFLRDLLRQSGVLPKIELIQVPKLGRSIYPGIDFTHPAGLEATVEALSRQWPAERENILRFHELMRKMTDEVSQLRNLYLDNPLTAALKKFAMPLRQRTLFKYRNTTLKSLLDRYFTDEALKAVVGQFWLYQGPPPSKQWGIIYLLASYSYIRNGAWQIRGSSQALADAYRERIEELGGRVQTDTLVTAIDVEKHRARGVVTGSGERFTARYVVSNADPFQTFFRLVGDDKLPGSLKRKVRKMEPSNSFVGVYLGLDVEASHFGISDYEIFLNHSLDIDAMYRNMMAGRYDQGFVSLTFYSNLNDPFYAPKGKSVLVLNAFSNMALWPERGPAYEKQKDAMVEALIGMAAKFLPDLRAHIVYQEGMTPRTIESYTLSRDGVPYGWNYTPDQQGRLPITTPIEGLYMAGSWIWPAQGVGMAQLSGYLAARMIAADAGKR